MPDYSNADIVGRLEALGDALERYPEDAACPWPVARVFNELLKQARREAGEDPVLMSMRYLEEDPQNKGPAASNTLAMTVRTLIDQAVISLGDGSPRPSQGSSRSKRPPAPSASSRS